MTIHCINLALNTQFWLNYFPALFIFLLIKNRKKEKKKDKQTKNPHT